ncbi:glycoside hydrolase family 16 protein [Thalassotalea sp. M1531]|uniref:Glycoside hydrolase family 16 protein n=2 Tax=Thalassotalea algicola TaxID=2716224 RepID=A0A7Y0LC78_9GAMM|nr:glycoside hydrolase family 16 protein [Thalassotalea algicola]
MVLVSCGGSGSSVNSIPSSNPTTTEQTEGSETTISFEVPEVSANWQLIWSDEFEAGTIDSTKWSFERNCAGGGNNEQQCYTNRLDNAFIESGSLVIKALREDFTGPAVFDDSPNYDTNITKTQPYTSARLRTKNLGDWRYGRIEVRAKLPSGQGTWPAIWMLPTEWKYGGWAGSGEIDIMEAVNLKAKSDASGQLTDTAENRVHGTLHYGRKWPENVYSGTSYSMPDNANPADDFHLYAIEWQAGEIRWYVDGAHYATQNANGWYSQFHNEKGEIIDGTGTAPFDQKFHLILNFAVGGDWPATVNEKGIDESAFPQLFEIDYVRVYQCSIDADYGRGCEAIGKDAKLVEGHTAPPL